MQLVVREFTDEHKDLIKSKVSKTPRPVIGISAENL